MIDEETRKKRDAQIKKLEDVQNHFMSRIKGELQDEGIRGRIRFWFLKSFIKKLVKKK
jgi:hypothetical protein